jgi:UDP-2,4-diacetamido-2,4,6-trideoxy-beta-L-altropyranose hydrolase
MHKSRVVFKADGNKDIGLGHIYRCIALAQILKSEFELAFLSENSDTEVLNLLKETFYIIEYNETNNSTEYLSAILRIDDIIVFDGYSNNYDVQLKFKSYVKTLVSVDDLANTKFISEIIFNHGDISVLPDYNISSVTKIYSGLNFLILRKEFLDKPLYRKQSVNRNGGILISFGSSDPYGITPKILAILNSLNLNFEINILTGLKSSYDSMIELIDKYPKCKIKIHYSLNANEIICLLKNISFAITTASTTALEICCCNIPLLIGTVVNNQHSIHNILVKNGCALTVDSWITADEKKIQEKLLLLQKESVSSEIKEQQNKSFDGKSSERILKIFKSL